MEKPTISSIVINDIVKLNYSDGTSVNISKKVYVESLGNIIDMTKEEVIERYGYDK